MRCAVPVQVVSCELRCRLPLRCRGAAYAECGAAVWCAVPWRSGRCSRGGDPNAGLCSVSVSVRCSVCRVLSAEPRWGAISCTECRCGAVRCRCGECGAGGPLNAVRCGC